MSALDMTADPRDERIRELEARLAEVEEDRQRIQAKLPPDQDLVAKEVKRRFLRYIADEVNPGALQRHQGDLSSWKPELFQRAGQLGLIGLNAAKEIGGEGRDSASVGLYLEELAKQIEDPVFLIATQLSKNWANLFHAEGRQDLVERYSRRLIRGELLMAQAHWEPADPSFLQSVARRVDGAWSVSGEKPLITAGAYAGAFVVFVREEESGDTLAVIVEREDPGVSITPTPTVGAHHGGFTSLTMKDVRVPDERVLFDCDAFGRANPLATQVNWITSSVHLGWMQRMFGLCIDALRPKVRAGRGVLDIPHVQRELGRLHIGIEASRGMFLRAMDRHRGLAPDFTAELPTFALWYFVTERTLDTAMTLMTLTGAAGYMDSNPWGRYLTHVTCLLHVGGAHDLLPMHVGGRLLMELEMKRLRRVGF